MAPTLRQEAQNSNSPNALTLSRFTPTSSSSAAMADSFERHVGEEELEVQSDRDDLGDAGHGPVDEYIQPDTYAPFLPNISPA